MVLAASIRHLIHVIEAARADADEPRGHSKLCSNSSTIRSLIRGWNNFSPIGARSPDLSKRHKGDSSCQKQAIKQSNRSKTAREKGAK
jgi:hypothetical protein